MTIPSPTDGATALVTGASAGIGVEFATQLAARGHHVTLVARRRDRLESLAARLSETHGVGTLVLDADLSDAGARTGVLDAVGAAGLHVDVLVNNAGFSTLGRVADGDPDAEVRMVRVNVEAVSHLCAAVLPGMVERRRGAICNVASVASFSPMPGQAGYAASKAFVRSYTEAVAAELAGTGVTISALCPGPVDTEFAEAAGFEGEFTDSMPRFLWVPAADVARAALEGLDAGKVVVVPGTGNRVLASVGGALPGRLVARVVGSQHPALRD